MTSPGPVCWQTNQARRPSSLQEAACRPSTCIDETGCVVTKGFVIPSRSSSTDSIAQSLASSVSTPQTPGTPASPIEEAPPGYSRPTGTLATALASKTSPSARHRPVRSASALPDESRLLRPSLRGRRSTWEAQCSVSSRIDDEELTESLGQHSLGLSLNAIPKRCLAPRPAHEHAKFARSVQQLHRSQTVRDKLCKSPKHGSSKQHTASNVKIVSQAEAEDAIASDSDEEMSDTEVASKMASKRNRMSYAERRARSDDMAQIRRSFTKEGGEQWDVPLSASPRPADAIETDNDISVSHDRSVTMERCPPSSTPTATENAIESDDEDDDPAVSASLNLAQLHRSRNSMTASAPATPTKHVADEPRRPSALARVKLSMAAEDVTTPTEIRSFEADAPLAQRQLQPSRSQPQPMKGVLKKNGSNCSSERSSPNTKHVLTAVKRSSLQLPLERARGSSPTVSAVHASPRWDDISTRFAPAA